MITINHRLKIGRIGCNDDDHSLLMQWPDRAFKDTNFVVLLVFSFCVSPVALVIGVIGIATPRGSLCTTKSRSRHDNGGRDVGLVVGISNHCKEYVKHSIASIVCYGAIGPVRFCQPMCFSAMRTEESHDPSPGPPRRTLRKPLVLCPTAFTC